MDLILDRETTGRAGERVSSQIEMDALIHEVGLLNNNMGQKAPPEDPIAQEQEGKSEGNDGTQGSKSYPEKWQQERPRQSFVDCPDPFPS